MRTLLLCLLGIFLTFYVHPHLEIEERIVFIELNILALLILDIGILTLGILKENRLNSKKKP